MRRIIGLGLMGLFASSGCTTAYATMSSHTVQIGADRSADVVWVLESNKGVLRCYDSTSGPVCVRANVTDTAAPPAATPAATASVAAPAEPEPEPAPPSTAAPDPAAEAAG